MKTLANLKPGQTAYIESIIEIDSWVERLMTLGLIEGAEVEYISSAIGSDPIELKLQGARMAIQREYAKKFIINEI